jgi:hypothetical protein
MYNSILLRRQAFSGEEESDADFRGFSRCARLRKRLRRTYKQRLGGISDPRKSVESAIIRVPFVALPIESTISR